ncbi:MULTISPECIES: GTP-sensing pleiotropic transcriptional regulator CodY [Proteiniclasticum]|jgi:transcriptional pleiotropic repressor|uniref:Global transcriptional regulator CodY n=1 Tax=Proteiniclasticum ruminis TaxID=398199 RepID=A0A1G8G211_9CLOT|nr:MULTISPECIES: GTP-sensing pleiotropic transcriptional regulator CodY [Proteiniclasticum]SDH88444.1 transcriptional pleiotropic repressor [Proteiniclasticum ruminis]HBW12480.1 GTP-sensing pleiotropic transcriptional regulator CodY [Proteiniclasticum sp.]
MSLLNKTRKLNKILQKSGTEPVVFDDICEILSEELHSDVYVVSRRGKILGHKFTYPFTTKDEYSSVLEEMKYSDDYNDTLLKIGETLVNLSADERYVLNIEKEYEGKDKITTIVPINGNRERLGTLILVSLEGEYTDEDIVLAEYSATIIGLEILRSKQLESEEDQRKNDVVDLAIQTLSYSEKEAVNHIFRELDGDEGLLVASRIADKVGITRSVIVNALRKLESAGVIKSRSLGMKGTRITILNDKLLEKLDIRK